VEGIPTDEQLALNLQTHQMVIGLGVWKIDNPDGSSNTGNWVRAIMEKTHELKVGKTPPPKTGGTSANSMDDSQIPF
jgi:hypothetical protein